MRKVVVGMSGGVDSAVSALLLQESGYDVSGVTLKLHRSLSDAEIRDAATVAGELGISHRLLDYGECFAENVITRFVDEYRAGNTPNPCILCNRYVKFAKMLEYASAVGADLIATGHYAVTQTDSSGRTLLKKAKDPTKDQTYVLYSLSKEQLSHVIFPLGNLTKSEVRGIATEHGFVNATKGESQDICFVPDGDYATFLENYTGEKAAKGNYLDMAGNVIGKHDGVIRYTIGQRKGLGISLGRPVFVVAKDAAANTVTIGDSEDLFSTTLTAKDINLIACDSIDRPLRVTAKVRYKQEEQPASVVQIDDRRVEVRFDKPQRAVSRGQSVVFYDGDIVVGGGIIE